MVLECPGNIGDVVRFQRPGGYWHFAIKTASDMVIHLTGDVDGPPGRALLGCSKATVSTTRAFVREQMYQDVQGRGPEAEVVRGAGEAAFDVERVLVRARLQLGESDYNLFTANCEHFVNWCRTGRAESRQVMTAQRAAAVVGAGGVLLTAVATVTALAFGLMKK